MKEGREKKDEKSRRIEGVFIPLEGVLSTLSESRLISLKVSECFPYPN